MASWVWLAALCLLPAAVNTMGSGGDGGGEHPELRLYQKLLSPYNRHLRPAADMHQHTSIFFELSLFNLLRVDTKEQFIITNSEIIMKWMDPALIWNPADFGNITTIRVPHKDIWSPDIILQNTASSDYEGSIINTNAIILYTGEVELLSHAVLTSICIMDVQWYPFDQQTCALTFASWTFDTSKIKIIMGPADLSEFSQNPEFFLEDFYATLQDVHNPCCPLPISTVKFFLQIQRRTVFSLFFFIMPGVLINVCALMVFSLPSESGEKIGLGINSMLAMMVFLMAMTEKLPPTEKLPLAGVYYGACISMITLNIMCSVFVLNLNTMGLRGYQVPEPIRWVTLFIARAIVVRIPHVVRDAWHLDQEETAVTDVAGNKDGDVVRVFTVQQTTSPKEKLKQEPPNKIPVDLPADYGELKDPFQRRTVAALEAICGILNREEAATGKIKTRSNLVDEWKFVSRVLDRTLFLSFTLATLIFNLAILTSSPFRERFSYCPVDEEQCEGLTAQEIMHLTVDAASNMHFGGGYPDLGHLRGTRGHMVGLDGGSPNPTYTGYEGLGLVPQEGEYMGPVSGLIRGHHPNPHRVNPKYEGYEGLGLQPGDGYEVQEP